VACDLPDAQARALLGWPLDVEWHRPDRSTPGNVLDGMVRRGLLDCKWIKLAERVRELRPIRRVYRPIRRVYRLTADGLAVRAARDSEAHHRCQLLILDLALAECDAETA